MIIDDRVRVDAQGVIDRRQNLHRVNRIFRRRRTGRVRFSIKRAALNARISPLWIAEEQGLFLKYGIDALPVYLRGAPTLVAGLASGDMQLGRSGGSAMLAAVSGGYDFKLVATFSSRNTYDLIARPSIKRAEDLRG